MQYLGGKSRIAKPIAQVLALHVKPEHVAYYEPFVGGASVLAAVAPLISLPLYASDAFTDLIEMYKALQGGWLPPESITPEEYRALRTAEPSHLRTFAGFACSYSGKFFGGYARNSRGDNYTAQARNSLIKKLPAIQISEFRACSYAALHLPGPSLIYCDPPYAQTTGYKQVQEFDSRAFWAKAQEWAQQGHTVLVSEYQAPDGMEQIWAKSVQFSGGDATGRESRLERLFLVPKRVSIRVPKIILYKQPSLLEVA